MSRVSGVDLGWGSGYRVQCAGFRVQGSVCRVQGVSRLQGSRYGVEGHPFRGGLVFKAHGLVYHSTLGWRVIKKRRGG